MISNLMFQITPSQVLFPEYPAFQLSVKKTVTGWIFQDEVYKWSCLPGYTKECAGSISASDMTEVGGKGLTFYLYSKPLDPDNPAANPCYGILHNVPKNFTIGSASTALIHYGGVLVKPLLKGKSETILYSDWKLTNAF
jgi:hypothetical protein